MGTIAKFINKIKTVWPNLVYLKQGKSTKPLYRVLRPYYIFRHYFPFWKNILNKKAAALYRTSEPRFDEVQKRLIAELKENGIAITHLDELFPGQDLLPKLQAYSQGLMVSGQKREKGKTYIIDLMEKMTTVDLNNPFLKLALSPKVVAIANGYMDMYSKFFMQSLILVAPVGDATPISSQRWHRDPEDKKLCKIFVYLNDVDEETGPFTYATKTHADGKWGNLFPQRPPQGRTNINEEVLGRILPKENFKVVTGRAGAIVFADTTGIHRGGYAKTKQRLMSTAGFCSPASLWLPKFVYPAAREVEKIPESSVRYALQPWYDRAKSAADTGMGMQ